MTTLFPTPATPRQCANCRQPFTPSPSSPSSEACDACHSEPVPEPLAVPRVHLNGTGLRGLTEPLSQSAESLRAVRDVLRHNGPHMRDYYVLPDGGKETFERARRQHSARLERLEELEQELNELAAAIETNGR